MRFWAGKCLALHRASVQACNVKKARSGTCSCGSSAYQRRFSSLSFFSVVATSAQPRPFEPTNIWPGLGGPGRTPLIICASPIYSRVQSRLMTSTIAIEIACAPRSSRSAVGRQRHRTCYSLADRRGSAHADPHPWRSDDRRGGPRARPTRPQSTARSRPRDGEPGMGRESSLGVVRYEIVDTRIHERHLHPRPVSRVRFRTASHRAARLPWVGHASPQQAESPSR